MLRGLVHRQDSLNKQHVLSLSIDVTMIELTSTLVAAMKLRKADDATAEDAASQLAEHMKKVFKMTWDDQKNSKGAIDVEG
jgi:hypothetical protein